MRAGTLNTPILIQRREEVRGGGGQVIGVWVDHLRVWADFRHLSGIGAIKADSDVSLQRASVRIRYRTGITDAMRVVCAGVAYDIKAVIPDMGRREHLDLVVQSIPAGIP